MKKTKPMHPKRIKIMEAITKQPNITYKHLCEKLGGVSTAVVTHHIKMLKEKGVIRNNNGNGGRNDFEILAYSNPPTEPYYKTPK